jgi:hypothetical protein
MPAIPLPCGHFDPPHSVFRTKNGILEGKTPHFWGKNAVLIFD